jgi:hypothetical protein
MSIHQYIDTAKQLVPAPTGPSSEQVAQTAQDKTNFALDVAHRLAAAKPEEPKPVQLGTQPIAN